MKKFLILIVLFSAYTIQAQTFSELIATGDAQYQNKEYKASAQTYEKAFLLEKPNSGQLYNAACYWALAGGQDKALNYLEKSLEEGWINLDWMKKDTDLLSLHETTKWKDLTEKLALKLKKLEESQNIPLKRELESIAEKDQRHRKEMRAVSKEFGWKSKEMKALWDKQNPLDSLNTIRIIEIIEEFGYPGKSMVGNQASTAFLVIQHADLAVQEKYLPVLKAAAEKKELSWSSLALLIDRVNIRQGKKQIYGSQVSRDQKTGESFFSPIEDEANVNKRRAEVGLGPLEDYAKRFGFEYRVPVKMD